MTVFQLMKALARMSFAGNEQILLNVRVEEKQLDGTSVQKDICGMLENLSLTYPSSDDQNCDNPRPLIVLEGSEM